MKRAELLAIAESLEHALPARIGAAHELAELGDERAIRVDRVSIAGGVFGMGEPPSEETVAAFAIDRYPVTVASYAAFVESGGYRDRRLWSADGWAYRRANGIEAPRFWGESEWAAYLVPNHPVVGVSFYEAEAFARYREARLPTEAEWEKAARGTDARRYPWGNDWIDDACGVRGFGPRSTVPIGVFPKGVSPYGVRDMVGSVWQWCSDGFRGWRAGGSAGEPSEPMLQRTTCGGAWNTQKWSLLCQSRNGFPVTARFSNLGFRCVIA
ncbi:MAG TPA: SUMF1/EgtB/PvdO family nonheme iron enzyme [Polyangiaceae bacterium]|nr:SUMF1/EgtB/PvdO family nonheme iron enzyme [Polyangiaceae bacterium]